MRKQGCDFVTPLAEARALAVGGGSARERLQAVCELMAGRVTHYNWVGFYIADPPARELWLGPFTGDPSGWRRC